jgi:hypothetical protein
VHALDTVHRKAYCIDLPFKSSGEFTTVRLKLRGGQLLLKRGRVVIARVNTKTLEVRR